jgi:hypothetical protein
LFYRDGHQKVRDEGRTASAKILLRARSNTDEEKLLTSNNYGKRVD